MQRILLVFGTRPELIKLAPLYARLKRSSLTPVTCATGQHRELLEQANTVFGIEPQYQFHLMKENQDLFDITSSGLMKMREVIKEVSPKLILVQGDTTTAMTAALAAFYLKTPVGHVEAGLRTGKMYSPFPEEMNRTLISKLACHHFAPTQKAVDNLLKEGIPEKTIYQVGNTGIDSLLQTSKRATPPTGIHKGKKLILLTAHRRENFGPSLESLLHSIGQFSDRHPECQILYPVHPNPNVQQAAKKILSGKKGISLAQPLQFDELVWVLKECLFVVTDSGGLQEEAPTFGKPVLVMRDSTEREEAITAGCAKLVGTDPFLLLEWMEKLARPDSDIYQSMARAKNPFGDGTASDQITAILERIYPSSLQRVA